MSRWIVALASSSFVAFCLGGCGSDTKQSGSLYGLDSGAGFKSGVDGGTQLGNLTPSQQVTICRNQAAFVHASVDTTSLMRFVCAFTPQVFLAATDDACQSAMDACVNSLSVKVDVNLPTSANIDTVCSTVPITQCQGTVADYENCVDSIASVQLDFGTQFSCGKRSDYKNGPTVGVNACAAVGPSCTAATQPAQVR